MKNKDLLPEWELSEELTNKLKNKLRRRKGFIKETSEDEVTPVYKRKDHNKEWRKHK